MNKKIIIPVIAALLCVIILICGIAFGQKNDTINRETETVKPPVTLSPPSPETDVSGTDTPDSDTQEPPPYSGRTLTVLMPNDGKLLFGDTGEGGGVNLAAYERNLRICRLTGVTLLFRYSADIYKEHEADTLGGKHDIDLLTFEMKSDGSRFLMNGGLSDLTEFAENVNSGIDKELSAGLSIGGKTLLIVGDVTPSYVLAVNRLTVRKDSPAAASLSLMASKGDITYERLFRILAEKTEQLYLDESALHALVSGGLFSASGEGKPTVDCENYADEIILLSSYGSGICTSPAEDGYTVSVGPYIGDDYLYLPLPLRKDGTSSATADMSKLYPVALSLYSDNAEMARDILKLMCENSEGFSEMARTEYGMPDCGKEVLCYYDVFGWGDFSKHAYNALAKNKTGSLKKTLEAPTKAAVQALSVLLERNS